MASSGGLGPLICVPRVARVRDLIDCRACFIRPGSGTMPELSDYREGKKRRSTVLLAHSVVHLARHDHGLELLEVLGISTPTPTSRGQEAQLD